MPPLVAVKPGAVTVSLGPDTVYAFDGEGRLLAAHTAGRTFQRALDGRILEKLPSHKLLKGPWERRCHWHLSRLRVMPDSPCERGARAERVVPLAPDELVAQDRLLATALRRPGGPHVASYNI